MRSPTQNQANKSEQRVNSWPEFLEQIEGTDVD